MAKVTLDMETFKALASPTRLQVLRCLDDRRKTLSELSKEMDLNKATVHEHLAILVATGLVRKRDDEGRKWIYYELTWQGERLLHPQETTTFAVLLGFSVAAAGGGVLLLGRAMEWWMADHQLSQAGDADAMPIAPEAERSGHDSASDDGGSQQPQEPPPSSPPSSPPEGGAQSAMADQNGTTELEATEPMPEASDAGGMADLDGEGILGIFMLMTAVLLAVLAWTMRKTRHK